MRQLIKQIFESALVLTKERIGYVPQNTFRTPCVLEEFTLDDFTDEFFEDYTLILVPFIHGHWVRGFVEVNSVYADDGKLNFLFEITSLSIDSAVTQYLFAVIISNEILGEYAIGAGKRFITYSYLRFRTPSFWAQIENCRE